MPYTTKLRRTGESKSLIRRSSCGLRFIALVVIPVSTTLSGCALIEKSDPKLPGPPTEDKLKEANSRPLKIYRILQTRDFALDTVPVGAIVPYFSANDLRLPENWRYCNGDKVSDPHSPFNGMTLPKLVDERFLMGSVDSHGSLGGKNTTAEDGRHVHVSRAILSGAHDHDGKTGPENSNAPLVKVGDGNKLSIRVVEQGHRHVLEPDKGHVHTVQVEPAGLHNHGGDSRPNWFGVLYIIRIK